MKVEVLNVFTDADGRFGNPLGIVDDPAGLTTEQRQDVARRLGFSETVFIDDPEEARVQIFTPATELPFAGNPMVGTSWFLSQRGWSGETLRPPAGEIATWTEDHLTWITGEPSWAPVNTIKRCGSAAEVDSLTTDDCVGPDLYAWAWADESQGIVRARYLATGLGIEEDEATGSAAILLGSVVGRDVTIHQGQGSRLSVRVLDGPRYAVGGRVLHDRTIELD